ncbi:dienelactone hydrolase family protein [Paludisphaera mucosa]|uniref:Dienelactone hydrolase family protein n=1 Tax=Paludisphaera mucosa TaxID=3030827 RepID=A0ABT6FGV9_9BACT|nr:dienelactone hydrolase family protein [Paludisphaera mucosa]MDG3006826.1 dienelactone hydrolase family protein [Paludisphaera mucosa]
MHDDRASVDEVEVEVEEAGSGVSRRGFAATTLAVGFAAAVQPVSAQTITTDAQGLDAGVVEIPTADGKIPGYRALPTGAGPFPVVLVVQEIFGVHEHIKDICRRLAKLGYYAIAPELYFRQGDVSQTKDFREIIGKVVSKVPDAQVMSDLDAAVALAKGSKGDVSKLAITGFCWGGRIVWLYSAHNPDLKAGVAWYGRVVGDKDDLHPKNPIDVAADLKAPVLGLYGEADAGIPVASLDQLREAAKAGKTEVEIHVYPGAPHAFNADYRPSYRKAEAENGWRRLLDWFQKHGVAPKA